MLNSLPVYFMNMFKIPKGVAQKIVKLQMRFFWGESSGGKLCIPVFNWSSTELPKNLGGLGIGNILFKNLILLFKWWWRFSNFDSSLWKRILMSVHNIKGMKASSAVFDKVHDGIWRQLEGKDVDTSKI